MMANMPGAEPAASAPLLVPGPDASAPAGEPKAPTPGAAAADDPMKAMEESMKKNK